MEEKYGADQSYNQKFFDELRLEVLDRALDEPGAIVGRNDLDSRRKARFELRELRFDGIDGLERIFARAHDDDAAGDLSLTIKVGDSAPHLRANLDSGHIAQAHRDPGLGRRERDIAEVIQGL